MTDRGVTICMSTYNGQKYIREQIDSIRRQSYFNWVLLIHDDGSTDDTVSIIKQFMSVDDRIKLVSTGHLGVKKAFISLLSHAESEYYAFSDQDDIWTTNKIQRLIENVTYESANLPILIHSSFQNIDKNGNKLDDFKPIEKLSTDFKDILLSNTVTGCTCLFNKSLRDLVVSKSQELDYSMIYMHDWWLALIASGMGKVKYLNERLVGYRQHEENVLGAPGKNKFNRFLEAVRFSDAELIVMVSKQAMLFNQLYGEYLCKQDFDICNFVANTVFKFSPLNTFRQVKKYSLKSRSKYRNIEFALLTLLPIKLRPKVMRNLN